MLLLLAAERVGWNLQPGLAIHWVAKVRRLLRLLTGPERMSGSPCCMKLQQGAWIRTSMSWTILPKHIGIIFTFAWEAWMAWIEPNKKSTRHLSTMKTA